MAPPRPEIRYQRVENPLEEGEEEEVSIYLYSKPSSPIIQAHYRETCFRIFSSVLLLMMAFGFVLYNLEFRNTEASASQQMFLEGLPSLSNHDHHHHDSETSDHEEEDGDEHEEGLSSSHHHHSEGTFHQAVAVTDSETCSTLARDILQSGGSVVDAGITAVLCLAVVHPHTSSLGGVFSSIYFDRTQNPSVLHAIPRDASPVLYGVPQVLQGLWVLHRMYGKKPWAQLVSSAVILAEKGFLVDSSLHTALVANRNKVLSSEGLRSLFCDPHQALKDIGEKVENPTLGRLLEQISSSMSDSVLPDDFRQSLLSDIGVTEKDKFIELASRHLTIEDPLTLLLENLTLYTTAGPTAGKILSNSLKKIYNEKHKQSLESVPELLMNSSKIMYEVGGTWPRDLSSSFAPLQLPPWNPAVVASNVMIADTNGDMFVLSLTLNSSFGSGFVSPSTGILLSDFIQGRDSTQSSGPLYWACPSVLLYGEDNNVMGLSAYGGSSVPFSLTQVIISHLLLEMDLKESVTGSLVKVPPESSDPWMEYFGLYGNSKEPVVAVEVEAEHVHVMKSHGPCCYPAGL